MDRVAELLTAKNYGAAWLAAERLYGTMTYPEFLSRFVWGSNDAS